MPLRGASPPPGAGIPWPPSTKTKPKGCSIIDWEAVAVPGSPVLADVLADAESGDDFLVQLAAGLRGNGALASASPDMRLAALNVFEEHCAALCATASTNRVRMVYETLRDNLGSPARDGVDVAAQLRNAATRSLTHILITLNMPQRDARMVKFHVEALFRMLDGTVSSTDATAQSGQLDERRNLAAQCLRQLESAFPTLFYAEAGALLQLANKEQSTPARGLLITQLAVDALSNSAALYLTQQEEAAAARHLAAATSPSDFACEDSASDISSGTDEDTPTPTESEAELEAARNREVLQAAQALCGSQPGSDGCNCSSKADTPVSALDQVPFSSVRTDAEDAESNGPPASSAFHSTAVHADVDTASSASGNAGPSVRPNSDTPASPLPLRAETSVAAANGTNPSTSNGGRRPTFALDLRRSVLTSNLRTTSNVSADGMHSVASTPRLPPTEAPVVAAPSPATALRKFTVPFHVQTGDPSDAPRLLLTQEAQQQLHQGIRLCLVSMRRLGSSGVSGMVTALPPVLRAARPSALQLWPHLERLLAAGSTPLLRAVLDLHSQLPALFEGRGPALVEKVLTQANDASLSLDHRATALHWVLKQHAEQRHCGGQLLLADCWEQLLPGPRDPTQLTVLKVKSLAACLAAGVGEEEVICRAVCNWQGFGGGHQQHQPSEEQLRALTYALRLLHGGNGDVAAAAVGAPRHRLHACLAVCMLEMLVARPALGPAVDAFLETCPADFATTVLRAFNALLASVDGQFDNLRERPEDAAFEGSSADLAQRVKAAVLSRSSSLSGLMRGLSFRLSFTKRAHSVLPTATSPTHAAHSARSHTESIPDRPRRQVDVRGLRSSIAAAFQTTESSHRTHSHTAATHRGPLPPAPHSIDPSVADSYGLSSHHAGMDLPEGLDGDAEAPPAAAPAVPHDLGDWAAAQAWLSAASTWEGLAVGLLRQDLMAYRKLMQRAMRVPGVQPRGVLQVLSNFTWQYKEAHPTHALRSAKETAAALLALCHTAALTHLPWPAVEAERPCGWGPRQVELANCVQGVLDALEEGFPAPAVKARSRVLGKLLTDEQAWGPARRGAGLAQVVCGYIDAAVEG